MKLSKSKIFPVPTAMIAHDTDYKVYKLLLQAADDEGKIRLSNEEIAQIVGVSPSSTTITMVLSRFKDWEVLERAVRKNRYTKGSKKRILQLKKPYLQFSKLYRNTGPIHPDEFGKFVTLNIPKQEK